MRRTFASILKMGERNKQETSVKQEENRTQLRVNSLLKMDVTRFSELSVEFHRTAWSSSCSTLYLPLASCCFSSLLIILL
jgi:hypothetical protein